MFSFAKRPVGAKGCDLFSLGPDVSGKPGFPSGHMSSTSFVCVYNIILLLKSNYVKNLFKPNYLRYILIFVNVLLIFLMGWARHFKKCHNIIQILGGIVLGGGLASLLFILKKKI